MRSVLLTLSALVASALAADGSNYPQAKQYKDANTGITFLGFADGTGYQFGMAMPQSPATDFIAQLVSPLKNGAGWAGIDFGESMTGHLMVVAWPNGNKVMVAPRIASGYDISQTTPYTQRSLNLTQIPKGSFVNGTHVSATFICGGCIGTDAFAKGDDSGVFAFAYSSVGVSNPSDVGTQISDHTSNNEPYGPFNVKFTDAKSSQYDTWAALVQAKGGASGSGSSSSTQTSPSGSAGGSSPPSSSLGGGDDGDGISPSSSTVVILALIGVVYFLQVASSF